MVAASELRNTAKRALLFQRYVFRRTFGLIYAIWAVTTAISLILPFTVQTFIGTSSWYWIVYPLALSLIDITAIAITVANVTKARRTIALRNAINPKNSNRHNHWLTALWIAYCVLAAVCLIIFRLKAPALLNALSFAIEAFLIQQLRRIFSNDIPPEGKVAATVLGGSVLVNFVLSILSLSHFSSIPWIVMIFMWLFCALYALKNASEDWVAGTD